MTTEVQHLSNPPTIDTPKVNLEFGANKPLKMTTIKEAEFQITLVSPPSQPVSEGCPSQNKHFFCGMGKKLGCNFCAKTI